MWFEELTGFAETSPEQVRQNISVERGRLTSHINGGVYTCGDLEMPTLAELRQRVASLGRLNGRLSLREVVADVQRLHIDPGNAGVLFQVASQFNLLEMVAPNKTPEHGVGIYELDLTQGPACAIAAGAGTIYRNYFAAVGGQIGQTEANQLNGLADIGELLDNAGGRLWEMSNGYALAGEQGLVEISQRLQQASVAERDLIKASLRIGIQWNTQVTLNQCSHLVSQAYCSALPVAYSPHPDQLWAEFALLILEAAYEATLCVAMINGEAGGNRTVFLTLLGGGAFGNRLEWIVQAIESVVLRLQDWPLDVAIVSHGGSNPWVRELIQKYQSNPVG